MSRSREAVGIGIDVGDFLQRGDGPGSVAGLEHVLALHQQGIGIARIEGEHALQNFFGAAERAFGAQAFGGGGENLPGIVLLAQANVDFRQANPHAAVFRIHLHNLLEDADRVIELTSFQEFFRDLQILGAGVIEQALLAVEFRELQQALERRLELADLLVHRDGLDRETLAGIGIAYSLETYGGFIGFAEAGVEIADGVGDGQVLGVVLEDFFVLGDGILQFALLDVLLRTGQNLLLVETKQCHKSTNSRTCCSRQSLDAEPVERSGKLFPGTALRVMSHIGRWTDPTRPIVRRGVMNRMVTKGYQKGVYERVTKGIRGG